MPVIYMMGDCDNMALMELGCGGEDKLSLK